MKDIQREDVHIISRHSNIDEKGISQILTENIYNTRETWHKFLRLFFITLGVGFTVSGIIFFFAYNWADLNKFAKIGLTELLIIATTSVVLFAKISKSTKNIILTGSAVLVGALFAVYGQIYQTGANAYDFFLGWTIFIALWVIVSDFAPLWLIFLLLINTTFILYTQQVAKDWSEVFVCTFLFLMNAAALITAIIISESKQNIHAPRWFLNIVSLAAIGFATMGIVIGITDDYETHFPVLITFTIILFSLGIWHSLKEKNGFYLAVIPFSLIIIVSTLLFKNLDNEASFLLVSIFIILSITLVIWNLLTFQKKWKNEK
ncbi:DUF2157 domain-containing protein [Chryseobacterium sp. PBS4-4]|uniref:DUF2157 domain-containing protein n=1 Tax=Chryseobacterium edaphi TaxID=2976532 RepID=A0ABT2W701_9FLAO|nr:DUF2157 domain-containing protein [Chryseobacterium edaphi]MCU7617991.1 DUF2157 domain-containing protein [Chryseobacterium edaphi]